MWTTLFTMIAASMLGAWLGAGVVIQVGQEEGSAGHGRYAAGAACIFLMQALNLIPGGGATIGVAGVKLGVAIIGNFALGCVDDAGIGLYAPCLILVSLLGMDSARGIPNHDGLLRLSLCPRAACGSSRSSAKPARVAGLTIGGIPGVLLAAFIVKSLSLVYIRWLVIAVVLYTSITMRGVR